MNKKVILLTSGVAVAAVAAAINKKRSLEIVAYDPVEKLFKLKNGKFLPVGKTGNYNISIRKIQQGSKPVFGSNIRQMAAISYEVVKAKYEIAGIKLSGKEYKVNDLPKEYTGKQPAHTYKTGKECIDAGYVWQQSMTGMRCNENYKKHPSTGQIDLKGIELHTIK